MEAGGFVAAADALFNSFSVVWGLFLPADSPFCMVGKQACTYFAPHVDVCVLKQGCCFKTRSRPNQKTKKNKETKKNKDFHTTPESGLVRKSLFFLIFFGFFGFFGFFVFFWFLWFFWFV